MGDTTNAISQLPDTVSWGGKNGKQLVATAVVINKVRRPYLSSSTSDSVRGCAARMVFDKILPRVEDPFGPAELGTSAHSIFEALFNMPAEKRTMAAVSELIVKLGKSSKGPRSERNRWLASVNQLAGGIFLVEDPTKIEVIANELKIETTVNGVPVLGYIDRLGVKNKFVTVSDFKSGKVPNTRWGDKHGDQLRIYVAALRELGEHIPTRAEDLYTSFNTVREADISEDAITITLRDFKTSWEKLNKMLDEGMFPTKPSALCGWCPAQLVCPASSTLKDDGSTKSAAPQEQPLPDDLEALINPAPVETVVEVVAEIEVITETVVEVEGPTSSDGASEDVAPKTEAVVQKEPPAKESSMAYELKPWEEYDGDNLNLNSYAATAAFGLTSMSFDTLKKFNQRTTGKSVYALAATFVKVINDANASLGGDESLSFQAGRHTRLRGALHSAVDATPPPFGADEDAWVEWAATTTKRVAGIFGVALSLWEAPTTATPWDALVRKEA